jgi:hypothetical protein
MVDAMSKLSYFLATGWQLIASKYGVDRLQSEWGTVSIQIAFGSLRRRPKQVGS